MFYFNTLKLGFLSLVFFLGLSFLIPGQGESSQINLILTITTFLFAILTGFFISRASSRFDQMRDLVGREDALFLSLYYTSQAWSEAFSKKMADLIDAYYIQSYDFELSDYNYKGSLKYFSQMWKLANDQKLKNTSIQSSLLGVLGNIEESRNLASTISKEKVNSGQWALLWILSVIILYCLYYLKTPDTYSVVITTLLSTSLVVILLLLRDLLNLKFGGENSLLEESGQEVLECMGKLRYYNQIYLKKGYYSFGNKKGTPFRLGLHKPGEALRIKIVK